MSSRQDTGSALGGEVYEILYETQPPESIRTRRHGTPGDEGDNGPVCLTVLLPTWEGKPIDTTEEPLPLPAEEIEDIVGPMADYQSIWQSTVGNAIYLTSPPRILIQTPRAAERFYSLAIHQAFEGEATAYLGLLISGDSSICSSQQFAAHIPRDWHCSALPLTVVPLSLLKLHVDETTNQLRTLVSSVTEIEYSVQNQNSASLDFDRLIRSLHSCNSGLLKLEKEWHFEDKLIGTIKEIIDQYRQPKSQQHWTTFTGCSFQEVNFHVHNQSESQDKINDTTRSSAAFMSLESQLTIQCRRNQALEYDLSVLPRRIQNTFTALYNLNAQRDTKANIEIAEQSRQIATATLRDSSSMKTIAVLTLIFLPPTALCAFFSMSFFDWHAASGGAVAETIWIYFAVLGPLVFLVFGIWALLTYKARRSISSKFNWKSTAQDIEGKLE